jgi:hypothetical protein
MSADADSRQSRISVRLSESPVSYGVNCAHQAGAKRPRENRHEQARCGYQVMIVRRYSMPLTYDRHLLNDGRILSW